MEAISALFFTAILFSILAGFVITFALLTLIRRPQKRLHKTVASVIISLLLTFTGNQLKLFPDIILDYFPYIVLLIFISVIYLIYFRQVKNDMGGTKAVQLFTSFVMGLIVLIIGAIVLLWFSVG